MAKVKKIRCKNCKKLTPKIRNTLYCSQKCKEEFHHKSKNKVKLKKTKLAKSKVNKLLESTKEVTQKYYKVLLQKVDSGTITAPEMNQLKKLEAELKSQDARGGLKYQSDNYLASTRAVAKFYDTNDREIRRWVAKGCPQDKPGWYNLKHVNEWYLINIWRDIKSEAEDESILSSKRSYWKSKAIREETKVELEKKSVVNKNDVSKAWAARMAELKTGLLQLSDRLAPELDGQEFLVIRDIIHNAVCDLLKTYCRTGKFCKAKKKGFELDDKKSI